MKDTKNAGDMTLGKKIRQLRIDRRITQQELVGDFITRNMLSQIENDIAMPSMKTLQYLAEALEIPISYLVDYESNDEDYNDYKRSQEYDEKSEVLGILKQAGQSFLNNKTDECLSYCEKLSEYSIKGEFLSNYIQNQIDLYRLRCLSRRELNMTPSDFLKKTVDISDLCRYNIMLSEKFLSENDTENALDCLKQAEQLIEQFPDHPYRTEIYKVLEVCYVNLEDYKNAHLYSTKLLSLLEK